MSNKINFTREKLKKKAASVSDNFLKNYSLVLEVGLEPTKPYGGSPVIATTRFQRVFGADSRTRTEDLLFTKQLL